MEELIILVVSGLFIAWLLIMLRLYYKLYKIMKKKQNIKLNGKVKLSDIEFKHTPRPPKQ